jgi:hypothetical protein
MLVNGFVNWAERFGSLIDPTKSPVRQLGSGGLHLPKHYARCP